MWWYVRVQENTRVIRREPERSVRVRRPRESEPVGGVAEFLGAACLSPWRGVAYLLRAGNHAPLKRLIQLTGDFWRAAFSTAIAGQPSLVGSPDLMQILQSPRQRPHLAWLWQTRGRWRG